MNKNAEELYNELTKRGKFFDTPEAFSQELQTEDGAKFYYDLATKEGLWMDTFDGFKNDVLEKKKDGFLQRTFGNTAQAQMYAKQAEDAANKKEEERIRQEKINLGISDKDKQDVMELVELEQKAANPVSISTNGVMEVRTPKPELNQYGMPTKIAKPVNPDIERQAETKKAQMPAYLTRGENTTMDIAQNAYDRAMNTEEGKNIITSIQNKYVSEFKQGEAYKALLKEFYAGKVTEADINKAFVEQYGQKMNDDIWEGILGENGLMREYYDDASNKLEARLRQTESFEIEERIKKAEEKAIREAYKEQNGMYPEEDTRPMKWLRMDNAKTKARGMVDSSIEFGGESKYTGINIPLNYVKQARRFNEDALDLIDAVNNDSGFGKGIANSITDIDTFDMGIAELSRTKELIEILDKVEADEQLSEREELMLDAALNYFAVTSYYSNKLGRGYKAGQTTGASLPFIAQFMLTSGALASAEAAVKGGAQSLGKKIVKNLVKHGNKKFAKALSSKAVTVPLATISGLAEAGLEAGAMTAVFGMPKIEAGTQSRMLGEVNTTYNPETGEMEYLGRTNVQDEKTARRNAIIDTYVEYLSEMVLAKAFDPVGEWFRSTNMYKNILRTDIAGAIVDAWSHPTWKSIRTSTKFGSLPEEILEEELGGLLRLGLASDVNTAKEAGLDLDSQIDIVLGLAPTSIMFGAVGAGTYYGSLRRNAKHIRQSLSSDAQRELFDKLMEESRSGQFGDLAHDMIRNIVLDNEMSVEDKKANITSIVGEYQDLLSQETQKLAQQVNETENAANIDEYISNTRNNASDNIYQTIDSKGRVCSIVDGRVEISQNEYGWNQVDQDKSSKKVRVRYRKEDGSFTEPIEILTSELTAPVNVMNTEKFKAMALAKSLANTKGEDTFEYDGVVYDTTTGIAQGTVEEYAQKEEERKKKEEGNNKNNEPRVNTRPHKINGVFTVIANGKEVDIKVYSNNATQKNDGSIKGGTFSVSVDGKVVTGERREMYVEALSEKLKADHAKAVEEYNQRKAEEESAAAAAQPVEPVAEEPLVSEEDRVKAAAEAEKRSKIEAFPKDKAGNVLVDKLSPEEYFLYIEQENGVETATTFIAEQLAWEYKAIADIEASNKSPREKQTARMKHQAAIKGYEDAIVKYVGQESLDQITAARAEALQNTPPVQEGAPVEAAPVAAPVQEEPAAPMQDETPTEPAVAPEEDAPQDDVPAEADTTPLPPAEPETKGAAIEPIDLGGDDIVFVSNSSNVTRVAQRKEDGNLYFVDNGKPVSSAWKETASKVKVYYNGRPYYLLSKTARIGKNGSVVGLNITVHLAPEMYTGKDSELNEIPRDKISLDEQGNQTATGNKLAERVANYKSLSDFFNKVIYNAGGVKLTLGELLEIPVVNANKGKGAPSWQFQVKRFIEQQEGKRNQTDVRADIEAGLKELIADWNAYVKANGLTDVVTEDNATDYYNRLKELGGYTSNGLLVQSTDFNGWKLNSADATKNPILQLLVMLDQASELASEKGPSLRALEVSNIRGYVQKKPSSMTTEEIEAEMFLTNNQGERVKNDGISTQRYNALNAELERRQAPEREAQVQVEKELDEKERNQEEQLIDSYANEIVNLLAASSNGNAIQKAAARGRVIDMLKGNSTLRKGVYDKLASMQNEDSAELIESAMNLIAKHYPEVAKTSTKKAEQEKPKPATSTPSLKELNEEYNDIKSKLDEYYYETDEEIDAANKRLAELRALLENTEFMVGDVVAEHAESTKRIIKILKAAGIRVITFKNEDLPKYVSKKKLEELSDGQIVYGFASNDTIYLNEDHFNPNSPLHEFTHLWVTAYKQAFPNEWKRFVEIANKSALAANLRKPLKDGKESPYAKLDADEMASEVLSRYTGYLYGELDAEGKTAFENMMQAQTMEEKMAEKSLLNRIRNIWKKIISWFDKSIENEKNEDAIDSMIRQFAQAPMETLARGKDAVDELMLNNTSENSDNSDRNPTNFDKKFKKMQETLDKGGKNVLSLQEISELTDTLEDDLRQGNKPLVFERLPQGALQTLLEEQRTLREAITIAALRSRRAARDVRRDGKAVTSDENTSRDASNLQMEFDVRSYAKANGLWIEDPIAYMNNKYGEDAYLADGQESKVWADESTGDVVKVKTTGLYETLEEFLEGIILNNWIFKENSQTIEGFGYLEDGTFAVVYRTPYVRVTEHNPLTQDEKDEFMALYGFVPIGKKEDEELKANGIDLPVVDYNNYTNGEFEIRDLHVHATKPNILRDANGDIQVIDPIIKWKRGEHYRLSTPDEIKRDKENEAKLDAWVDEGVGFMIGPAAPSGAPLDPMLFDAEAAAKIQIKTHKLLTTFANPKASLPEEFSAMRELVATSLDRTEGIRWMQESIKKFRKEQGLPELGEGFDVRTMIEAMDSKIQNDTQAYINTTEKRLRKNIKKLVDKVEDSSFYKMHKIERELDQNGNKVELTPLQMIERYLIACDSIEREQLNGNPRGLADFYRRMGMDVYEFAEAFNSAFFSSSKGKQQFDELWDSIRACTNVSIDMGWQSGLISLEEYTEYKKRRYYVPERDFAEVENNEELAIDSHGYRGRSSNKLTAMKQAKGGDSLAANVLANICLHARDGIIKSHRNTVKKAMYDLLRANEEWCREYKVPIPKQVWYQKNDDGTVSRMVDGPSAEDRKLMADLKSQIRDIENEIINLQQLADATTDESVKEAYENDIADLREQIDMLTDMFPYLDEFDTRSFIFMTNAAKNESTVMVYVDGVAQEMIFPNMSIIAKALNGTYNKEGELEPAKKIGQAFASGLTVYNPAFFTVNVTRDIPFILKKGSSEYGFMFAPRFIARLAEKLFNRNLWKVVWNSDYKSLKDEHLREFFAGGANTGYTTIPEIRKLKEATKGWAKKTSIGWSDVKDLLSYMNTFSEVWTRSAAYSVVRDMGHTNEEAIKAAKNLSVNFNRKGLGNPFMNFFGSMSIFMNAAIQGACGYWRTFKGNEDTLPQQVWHGTRAAINFMLLPAFVGFIDTLLNPDDDDEKLYYSDYDRDNYALLGFLHEGIRIPLNEQVKPFWCLGVNIALGMQGRRTKEQITNSMVSTVVTNLLPLPPVLNSTIVMAANGLTGQKDFTPFQVVENMITPQALSGIYDLSNNVNFMGTDIRIEAGDRPQYMLGENEEYFCRQVAWWAYLKSGGNRDYPSRTTTDGDKIWADWNPKQVSAVRNMVIPSTYRDVTDFFTRVIVNAAFPDNPYHGEEAKWEDFATVRRFYKPRDREMGMYSITKDAKAIVKANNERKANAQKLVKGGAITKNNAMRDEAELRLRQTLSNRDAKLMSEYITVCEQLSIRGRAKEYGLTEKQFMDALRTDNKEVYKVLMKHNNITREKAVDKLLQLTRKYKSISIEDMTLLEAFGVEE